MEERTVWLRVEALTDEQCERLMDSLVANGWRNMREALTALAEQQAGAVPAEPESVAPLVALADEYISGAHPDSTVAKNPRVIRDFVKWVLRVDRGGGPNT